MKEIVTAIDVAASPERVWSVLADFDSHYEWNPFIRSISGPLKVGEHLAIHIAPPGGKGMRFKPRLLTVEPERELRWKGKLLVPGLFDGEHYFLIERLGDGVRLRHGERFSGLLVAMMPASSFEQIRTGFDEMNQALRKKAEAKI